MYLYFKNDDENDLANNCEHFHMDYDEDILTNDVEQYVLHIDWQINLQTFTNLHLKYLQYLQPTQFIREPAGTFKAVIPISTTAIIIIFWSCFGYDHDSLVINHDFLVIFDIYWKIKYKHKVLFSYLLYDRYQKVLMELIHCFLSTAGTCYCWPMIIIISWSFYRQVAWGTEHAINLVG